MQQPSSHYKRHRFPGEIISHAVWLYSRFLLSYRDVEELLAERGIAVSYETVRHWCKKFGQPFADRLRRRRARPGSSRRCWVLGAGCWGSGRRAARAGGGVAGTGTAPDGRGRAALQPSRGGQAARRGGLARHAPSAVTARATARTR